MSIKKLNPATAVPNNRPRILGSMYSDMFTFYLQKKNEKYFSMFDMTKNNQ